MKMPKFGGALYSYHPMRINLESCTSNLPHKYHFSSLHFLFPAVELFSSSNHSPTIHRFFRKGFGWKGSG